MGGYHRNDWKIEEKADMAKEKVARKRLLKEPDEFITISARMIGLLRHYGNWAMAFGVLILLVGLGIWGWRQHQERTERQAMELQAQAQQVYRNALEQTDETARRDLMAKAVDRFQKVIQQYQGTHAAWVARIYRGHACYALGRYEEAIHDYESAMGTTPSGRDLQEMRALALQGLGYAWMAKGDRDKALEYFQLLKERGGAPFQRTAQWNIARLLERQGRSEEALEIYKEIEKSFAEGYYGQLAKAKVAELSKQGEGAR
jgi:tetratricopeptide (TPR) repeat protein